MKQIVISKMFIKNFKGIVREVDIDFEKKNLYLFGKNGTGKTTIFDAFNWVLFGKDSLGRSDGNKDFEIKPKNKETGEAIHNLETEVLLSLYINDDLVELRKIYKEVYTKKRGSNESEFTGHTTEHFVNGVPKLKREYEDFIKENIATEEIFRVLTDVYHFQSDAVKPADRRNILEKLATKTEMEIVEENPVLSRLKNELIMGRSVEDVIKIQQDTQKRINRRLKEGLPAEIKSLIEMEYPNLPKNFDLKKNDAKLEESYKKLSDIESKLSGGTNQAEVQEYRNAIAEIENSITKVEREIDNLEYEAKSVHQKEVKSEKDKLTELEYSYKRLKDKQETLKTRIENGNKAIKEQEEKKTKLYKEFDEVNEKVFTSGDCSHCGQALPVEKLEEAKEHFNKHKSESLEAIKAKGLKINEEIEKYEKAIDSFEKELKDLDAELDATKKERTNLETKVKELENKEIVKSDEVKAKEEQLEKYLSRVEVLKKEMQKAREKGSNDLLENAKKEIQNEITLLNTQKAEYDLKLQNEKKIKALETEQSNLRAEFEAAETLITLGERFREIRAKSLSEEINSHFEIVKFNLFREFQTGGIENICEAEYRGTLYGSCSNGEKINMGLDIINGLQKIYGVTAPIFIDNSEAVSHWLVDSKSQLVKMFVDPEVEVLEIGTEEE